MISLLQLNKLIYPAFLIFIFLLKFTASIAAVDIWEKKEKNDEQSNQDNNQDDNINNDFNNNFEDDTPPILAYWIESEALSEALELEFDEDWSESVNTISAFELNTTFFSDTTLSKKLFLNNHLKCFFYLISTMR